MQFSVLANRQNSKRFLFRFFNVSSYVGSFKVSLLFLTRKKSTSSFLASKLGAESFLLKVLGFIKRIKIVENVYDLCQPSMFSTKPGSNFPPWAKPCNRVMMPSGKLCLQAARKKSRKLTDHAWKTTSTARADSNVLIVFSVTRRELCELIGRGEGGKM